MLSKKVKRRFTAIKFKKDQNLETGSGLPTSLNYTTKEESGLNNPGLFKLFLKGLSPDVTSLGVIDGEYDSRIKDI